MKNLLKRVDGKRFPLSAYLTQRANEAYINNNYLESAIIYFQTIDGFLRLTILILAERKYFPKSIFKKLVEEDRFTRLINYFQCLEPNTTLYLRLVEFNKKRNKLFHELYFYETPDILNKELKGFCEEAKYLIKELGLLVKKVLTP